MDGVDIDDKEKIGKGLDGVLGALGCKIFI